jgi:hypothetical protein
MSKGRLAFRTVAVLCIVAGVVVQAKNIYRFVALRGLRRSFLPPFDPCASRTAR